MKTFNFIIIIVNLLLVLNLVEFVLCQAPTAAPVEIIPKTIGTVTKQPSSTTIPEKLVVPQGHNFAFLLYARGNREYQCIATSKQWLNRNTTAMLINDRFDQQQNFNPSFGVVDHYISSTPIEGGNYTWSSLLPTDNSWVVAKFVDSVDATQSDVNIPWEITLATSRTEGGRLSNASYILRVNTAGGVPPPVDQCGVQYVDGFIQTVTYDAEYWFYEGPLPSTQQPASPASPQPSSPKSNNGYRTKSIGLGQLGWTAMFGFVTISVMFI